MPRHRPRRHTPTRPAVTAANTAATVALLAACAAALLATAPHSLDLSQCHIVHAVSLECG